MRTRAWAPLVAAGVLLLGGCGGVSPGTASVVQGERITTDEVNELVEAQCRLVETLAATGQGEPGTLVQAKQGVLGFLITVELREQFAAEQGVRADPALVRSFVEQQQIPGEGEDADTVRAFVQRDIASQLVLAEIGAAQAGQELGEENIGPAFEAGSQLFEEWSADAEIETDPRYAPGPDGVPGGGEASVSRPVSEIATGAGGEQADPTYVASLPPSQRCGG